MKKITLLLSLAFLAFSCSDDDDSTSSISTADLVGQWTLTSIVDDGESEDLNDCELQTTITFTETDVTEDEFYTTGEGECSSFDYTMEYILKGNEYYIIYENEGAVEVEESYEGDISISGDNLTITFEATAGSVSYSYIETYIKS